MLTLLLIVGIMQAMTAAIGAYQDYLTLGTSSYMQLSPHEGEAPHKLLTLFFFPWLYIWVV